MTKQAEIALSRDRPGQETTCAIRIKDRKLIGHQARFRLVAEVKVHDKRAINDDKILFETRFSVTGERTFTIPGNKLRAHSYKGKMIDVQVHAALEVDDAILFDSKITQEQEIAIGIKPAINEEATQIIEPNDVFQFFANLRAIPFASQIITLGLALLGGIVMRCERYRRHPRSIRA